MRTFNIFLLLIVVSLWTVPAGFAFYPGEELSDEQSSMIEEIKHKRIYHQLVEEKKRLSKEAIPVRKKRKAVLTPFVYDTPQEFADLEKYKRSVEAEKERSPKGVSKFIPSVSGSDVRKAISGNILINLIVMFVCIATAILLPFYLRRKK